MGNYQKLVREFQIISDQPVADKPTILSPDEEDFRDTLLREELRELKEAIIDEDRVEILDALCDLKYVNDGTANQMGVELDDEKEEVTYSFIPHKIDRMVNNNIDLLSALKTSNVEAINTTIYALAYLLNFSLETFKEALERVHRSNMTKFCVTNEEIDRTLELYKRAGVQVATELKEKVTVIYRKKDRKVLKNVNYIPVHLKDLVDANDKD